MSSTLRKPPPPHVVIVGGGLAGLASAVALCGRGLRLTLLESRPRLGGRASSFTDPVTGELVDNCQHVSMTCCTNLADFCRRVGTSDLFHRPEEIRFIGLDGRVSTLRAGILPAPFHLAGSFLQAKYLSLGERLRVGLGMACLRFAGAEETASFSDWLLAHGQTPGTIDRFWGTVLVSALNELPTQMDVGHARKVFLDGFLRNRRGFTMELPIVPLGELYGRRMESWLAEREVSVRLTTGVRSIDIDRERSVQGITLRDGEAIPADFVISAVPFDRVRGLFPDSSLAQLPGLEPVERIESSPITGVHLWFDRPVCPHEHAVTVGRLVQWVFNHTALQGRRGIVSDGGQYLQIVISASYDLLGWSKPAILDAVLRELESLWPEVGHAKLERSWVVTEHGATFAVRPGIDRLRPPQRTPIDGLFLAGDWTATGWPATMEGAVRSGYLAAEGVLEDLGRPERLVCPELADGLLARLMLGPRRDARTGDPEAIRDTTTWQVIP